MVARVAGPQRRNKVFLGDMRVTLRRSNGGVPQNLLHDADVCTVSQQKCCDGVPAIPAPE
jgi:hypothetical protein